MTVKSYLCIIVHCVAIGHKHPSTSCANLFELKQQDTVSPQYASLALCLPVNIFGSFPNAHIHRHSATVHTNCIHGSCAHTISKEHGHEAHCITLNTKACKKHEPLWHTYCCRKRHLASRCHCIDLPGVFIQLAHAAPDC